MAVTPPDCPGCPGPNVAHQHGAGYRRDLVEARRIDAGRPGARRDRIITIFTLVCLLLSCAGICLLFGWLVPTWPLN